MDFKAQRARHLISWMAVGTFCFLILGYIAKACVPFAFGILAMFIAINVFMAYLFFCYPDLREEVGLGVACQILAGLLLWL